MDVELPSFSGQPSMRNISQLKPPISVVMSLAVTIKS